MTRGTIVRFESRLVPGKWFVGRVRFTFDGQTVVDDVEGRWKGHVVTTSRLERVRR